MAYTPDPTDVTEPVDSRFASTAAAEFRALKAYVASIVSGGGLGVATPGQIVTFPGDTPPPGWLVCDGSLQLRATYPELWAMATTLNAVVTEAAWTSSQNGCFSSGDLATNFRLPDLRGLFVRSFNQGKAGIVVDPGRVKGSYQGATEIYDNGGLAGTAVVPQTGSIVKIPDYSLTAGFNYNAVGGAAPGSVASQFCGIRPSNIALMHCIKT